MGTEILTSKEAQDKAFKWIREKLYLLEEKVANSIDDKHIFEAFKREVTQNVKIMI